MTALDWLPIAILFSSLALLLITGLPIAFSMGSIAAVSVLIFLGAGKLDFIAMNTYGMMRQTTLIAMALFIFMACVLEKSGVADDLYSAMHQWLGGLRGGLAIGTVLICTIIAAMSGVSAAGTLTMGIIALPIMLDKGYAKSIAIGPILAGGALGLLIPPSCDFILYGMMTRVSIGRLFAGGVFPGLILASLYISYIGIRCYFQPHLGPPLPSEERVSLRKKVDLSRGIILPILLIVAVLGAIFLGIASPTEAASVGATGAIICAAINRKLSWQTLKGACHRTILINGMVMWILFGASCFSSIFIKIGGPQLAEAFVLALEVKPIYIILMMMVSYFILGCAVDEITILMITIPVYSPIVLSLGYDPVWFGVLFLINVQMAYLTPPFGFNLFYMKGIAPPGVTVGDIYRSIIPFIPLQWAGLLLVMFFPQLALWLPNVIFGLM